MARSRVKKFSSTYTSRRRSRCQPITTSSCPRYSYPSGDFYWLSAPRPIVPPGTPFPAGFTDLQEWIRNEDLAPDWLRVGTDIVVEARRHSMRPSRWPVRLYRSPAAWSCCPLVWLSSLVVPRCFAEGERRLEGAVPPPLARGSRGDAKVDRHHRVPHHAFLHIPESD